ncbi:MAG: GH25 family lysozyme [Thermoleophilia bacterium]
MTVQGQDYSHYNETVDFALAVKSGQSVFYFKAGEGTQGNGMQDKTYQSKRLACLPVAPFGPYHFLKMTATAPSQAAWFKKCAPEPTPLPPFADIEQHPFEPPNNTIPLAKKRTHVHDYLLGIEQDFLRRPIVYTGVYWWKDNIGDVSWAKDYQFVFAAYLFYKEPIPANFNPYWPGPRTLPPGVPRENVIGWQWAGDIPNPGKYPWASGAQDFNTFDDRILDGFKPPLTIEERVSRLEKLHPEIGG